MNGKLHLNSNDAAPRDLSILSSNDWEPRILPYNEAAHKRFKEILGKTQAPQTPPQIEKETNTVIKTEDTTAAEKTKDHEVPTNHLMPILQIKRQFGSKVAAAAATQRARKIGRRLGDVFTTEVLAYLHQQHRADDAPEPLTFHELGQKNGLLEVSASTMHRILNDYLTIQEGADSPQQLTNSQEETFMLTISDIRNKFGLAVAAAVEENRERGSGRKYDGIFTVDVCEMLYRKHLASSAPYPMSFDDLAKKNGLIEVGNTETIKRFFIQHGIVQPNGLINHSHKPAPEPEPTFDVEPPPDPAPEPDFDPKFELKLDPTVAAVTSTPKSDPPFLSAQVTKTIDDDYSASWYVEAGLLSQQLDNVMAKLKENPVVNVKGSIRLEMVFGGNGDHEI